MTSLCERVPKCAALFSASLLFVVGNALAQAAPETPNAAQIELLETKYRFETNGDSRKEVHALVKINSELGVRQFARLNFDYNRSFQSVEIPLVHITHTSGGTADILPSAINDVPNPAVEKFPAYQDVRVKSVRILGLEPGDSLEYRVITTTTKPPLAPDFWLSHSFDHSGVATRQSLEVDLPKPREIQLRVKPTIATAELENSEAASEKRLIYRWQPPEKVDTASEESEADIMITTFASWQALAEVLGKQLEPAQQDRSTVWQRSSQLAGGLSSPEAKTRAIYNFVSQKVSTVELPLGTTGFRTRAPAEILTSGYATAEDKFVLLQTMVRAFDIGAYPAFVGSKELAGDFANPAVLSNLLVVAEILPKLPPGVGCGECGNFVWLDPSQEVAPFEVIPASLRGRKALFGGFGVIPPFNLLWQVPQNLPYDSAQIVRIDAVLGSDGRLSAKVKYALRGDNELLLRVTFHKIPGEKQLQIAQYLALSDGFRGKVTSVKTSDPYETEKPFEVEYELTQEKFVDWSKKPVRIPALLPLPGLPEAPKKPTADAKIELGPPLKVDLRGTLRLPPGATAQAPPGTSVKRDYASFTAEYSAKQNVIHFSRHLNFVSREISGARFVDFGAFLHAVQNDQAQLFVLEKSEPPASAKPK